jgi:hypothetical protein
LGFPQTDRQARALEALLKTLPKEEAFRYRKRVLAQGPSELTPGERADVSWISTEDPDRQGDVVLARGMNDTQFALNPIVTMQHSYQLPPAGQSLWRKRARADFGGQGIKAKTYYPPLPEGWPSDKDWVPDVAFTLVQSRLLNGKSIGFLPVKVHTPNQQEIEQNGWQGVALVVDEWILLEYACVFLPAQQHAVVEQVAKMVSPEWLNRLGIPAAPPPVVPHCRLATIEQALTRSIERIDARRLAERALREQLDRRRGRV